MTRVLALVMLASVAYGCQAPIAPAAPAAAAAPAALALASLTPADLDAFITRVVQDQHAIGVNVGVMHNGKVVLAKGYGLANTAAGTPVTPETLFAVGSITKQFTCTTVLQLEQEHKLSLDDRVVKYEPSLTRAADITLRDLGNHVSGYRDYYPLDFVDRPMAKAMPSQDVVKAFASRPLDFEPGARYSYSNTGYLLLGRIAEKAGGEPIGKAFQRRIFTVLGMAHTRFEPKRGEPGLAEGYTPLGLGAAEPSIPEGDGWIGAAGGIWSTPTDLMTWDFALMEGNMMSPEAWKKMTTPRALSDGRSSGYGCGLQIRDRGPVLVLQHSGGVSGFNANNVFIPSSRSAVVVLANADWSGGVMNAITDAVLAKMVPAADAPIVAGRPAKDVALDLLAQIRANKVDRSLLSDELSAFLTPERLAVMSKSLADAGEVSGIEMGPISERGGMEVSQVRLLAGATPIRTLMYRTPDGKIQEFLFNRR